MSALVGTLVLLVVALLGARFSFSTEKATPGPRLLLRTGTHFLLIGFALGPSGLGLLTPDATEALFPFIALGIGWVGFHFGLQLDKDSLKLFPARNHLLALGQALLTFVIFAGVGMAIASVAGFEGDTVTLVVLVAACTAAVTTPAGIGMVSSTYRIQGPARDLLFFTASLDALVGITALQVTYSLFRPEAPGLGGLADLRWLAAAVGMGIVLGIVFVWLTRYRPSAEELTLYLLGFSAFAAGAALRWGLSPLFVSVTMGAVVANFGAERRRVLPFLQRWEQMVYVTFLLLSGALLRLDSWLLIPAAVGYALLRGGAKVAATGTMVTALGMSKQFPRRLGLGLIPQGGISLALAVSAVLVYSDLSIGGVDAETSLFAVVVVGVVLSELAGPLLTVSVLRRAGELTPERMAPTTAATAATDRDGADTVG